MVYSIRIAIFAVKKIKWQENKLGLIFVSTFCKSLTSLLTDHTAQRENYFLSVLASLTDRWV